MVDIAHDNTSNFTRVGRREQPQAAARTWMLTHRVGASSGARSATLSELKPSRPPHQAEAVRGDVLTAAAKAS